MLQVLWVNSEDQGLIVYYDLSTAIDTVKKQFG